MLLGPQFSRQLPSPLHDGAGTFVDLIQKVRSIGTGALMQQMATQRDDLLDCLSAASGKKKNNFFLLSLIYLIYFN